MSGASCEVCGGRLLFAPDGRSRQCERCDWQEQVERKRPSANDLVRSLQLTSQNDASERHIAGVKVRLTQGIAAAKAGDSDEAFYCFDWVLHNGSTDSQRAEAWLWLSQIYEDDAERRICLEQALAHEPMNPLVRRGLALVDGRINPQEIVNPDAVQEETAVPTDPQAAKADHFRCPRCAARMNYTPDGTALVCEYCRYRQDLDAADLQVQAEYGIGGLEQDFIAALATAKGHLQPVAMRVLSCQGCGIELLLPPQAISVTCPYCDAVYVAEAAETREILPPQALIPFKVNEDEARQALIAWFKKHKIERPRITPFVGIYLPVWTFDIGGEIRWKGKVRRGDDWVPVSGNKHFFYDDVLVLAGEKLRPSLTKALYQFDMAGLVAYDPRFLADWPAERYQLALADASLRARQQLIKDVRKRQEKLSPGQYVHDLTVNSAGLLVESYKLILLPMWIVHFKFEEKVYDVVINGQSSVVRGERPQNVVGKLFSWLKRGLKVAKRYSNSATLPFCYSATMTTLTSRLLLSAYSQGVFPMAHEDGQIYWYDPDPRAILPLADLHISRSLARTLKQNRFEIRVDSAFTAVMRACATPAPGREETWINDEIITAFTNLHHLSYAHSVEAWFEGKLVGGLYGVALRGLFAGESMFSRRTDASKVALVYLVNRLRQRGFRLLDVQFLTDHLARLGAIEITQAVYKKRLAQAMNAETWFN